MTIYFQQNLYHEKKVKAYPIDNSVHFLSECDVPYAGSYVHRGLLLTQLAKYAIVFASISFYAAVILVAFSLFSGLNLSPWRTGVSVHMV